MIMIFDQFLFLEVNYFRTTMSPVVQYYPVVKLAGIKIPPSSYSNVLNNLHYDPEKIPELMKSMEESELKKTDRPWGVDLLLSPSARKKNEF